MRVLISYYSHTGNTEAVAEAIASVFREKKAEVTMQRLKTLRQSRFRRKRLSLNNTITNFNYFDLVFLGTPTRNLRPSRAIREYLKECSLEGKEVALFVTGMGFPGKTVKKLSSHISSRGGTVLGSRVFKSILSLSEKRLVSAHEFAEEISKKKGLG